MKPRLTTVILSALISASVALGLSAAAALAVPASYWGATCNSGQWIAFGQSGATNPAFGVDCSAASSATGEKIVSAAAGGGVADAAISSGNNENRTSDALGTGTYTVQSVATGLFAVGNQLQRKVINLASGATAMTSNGDIFTWSPQAGGGTETITCPSPVVAGHSITVILTQVAVDGQQVITFGTGCKANGTLTMASTSGTAKQYSWTAVGDGTNYVEVSRLATGV